MRQSNADVGRRGDDRPVGGLEEVLAKELIDLGLARDREGGRAMEVDFGATERTMWVGGKLGGFYTLQEGVEGRFLPGIGKDLPDRIPLQSGELFAEMNFFDDTSIQVHDTDTSAGGGGHHLMGDGKST